jgi:lactate dehydrogenase-like 2-hydroxyacid dehydrogenase
VDADLMKALLDLGAIVHQGAGYDTIDVAAARRLGIGVSNTPDVLNDTVADAAVGLILATMRGLCTADRHVRAGLWRVNGTYPLGPRPERITRRHFGPWPHRLSDRHAVGRI